jgi:carbon monoxide dehydrogenase subunit G
MSDFSYFESRTGKLTSSAEEVFGFLTDTRNFERFIPNDTITNWQAEKESCSFNVSMLGTVSLRLSENEKYKRVVFHGDALKKNDFEIVFHITGYNTDPAEVKVSLKADLNPVLKMMAAKPLGQFLEILIKEMENFNSWSDIKV